ncbi:MAG: YigZ family protein [Firmicutes bacterium]|nr:YigZ family protein [Bacillota bacterium]
MVSSYRTVAKATEIEFTEKKSRFIGTVAFVDSEEAAQKFLARVKGEHKGARHYVWGYVLGTEGEVPRATDDGEPSGTAGRHVLDAIRNAGLTNTMVVVTRYFGGILLGTGGLSRAYARAAQEAVAAAGAAERKLVRQYLLLATYADLPQLEQWLAAGHATAQQKVYAEQVCLTLLIEAAKLSAAEEFVRRLPGGAAELRDLGTEDWLAV